MFDAEKMKIGIVQWIREWFVNNGDGCNAIVGISGGKDSSIVATLCVEALGKDRVIGVIMPNLKQDDICDSYALAQYIGIKHYTIPITLAICGITKQLIGIGIDPSNQTTINLPARIRMATLYAVSQSMNGRVANTSNLSENWVGYSTRYGDGAGDFSPLALLTVGEIIEIGNLLDIPQYLVTKIPSDGLCGKTDEDNLGFTYEQLDNYIRNGICEDQKARETIDYMHKANEFKLHMPESYCPDMFDSGEEKNEDLDIHR